MGRTAAARLDDDVALLAAHREGDDRAFARLMLRYETRLRGMCFGYLGDAEAVEDVVQDTFCQVLERLQRVDAGFNVSAWIHRIAANLCIDELRRRARRGQNHVTNDGLDPALVIPDEDRQGRPEDAFEIDVTRSLVRAAILQLPARQRDVLILRDIFGRSEAATASTLGLSTGAVQGVLHRARNRFKDIYVALESDCSLADACAQVVFIFEHLQLRSMRKDRLKAVQRHLGECQACETRFGHALLRVLIGAAGLGRGPTGSRPLKRTTVAAA